MSATRRRAGLAVLLALLWGGMIAACWSVPYRLACGPGGSYYTFGYIADEYTYAERIQPLIAGTTAANPVNGLGDTRVISQFFLEDSLRAVLTAVGGSVISFAWVWRVAFPLAMAGAFWLLSAVCIARRRRPWSAALRWAAGGAAFALLWFLYDMAMPFPPLHCWLNRVPTNIEFFLSALLAAAYLRFIDDTGWRRGAVLAAASVVLIYLRPYTAVPWGLVIGGGLCWLLVARRCSARTAGVTCGLLLLALLPLAGVAWWNSRLPVFSELVARYYDLPRHYEVHPRWPWHVGTALLIGLAGLALERRRRVFGFSIAVALALFPFTCGLLTTISKELLLPSDRHGPFYLIALLAVGLCVVGRMSAAWRGREGAGAARRWTVALTVLGLAVTAEVSVHNAAYQFVHYRPGYYQTISDDTRYLKAYEWIRQHTPADAMFMIDDGYDWRGVPTETMQLAGTLNWVIGRNDLFSLVARRPRLYSSRLYGNALSNADMEQLAMLHLGTFGFPIDKSAYIAALKRFHPEYVFWRKTTAPIPRGYGVILRKMAATVYADETCEIWKMDYGERGAAGAANGAGQGRQ